MNLAGYQERVTRVCFAAKANDADLDALGHKDRWLTYRRMVRSRLIGVVRTALPRTTDALGDACSPLIARWFDEAPPSSPIFHRLPAEFARFAQPTLSPSLRDLLRFETTVWTLRAAIEDGPAKVQDLSFEAPIVLQSAIAVLELDHASQLQGDDALLPAPTRLLLYRNAEHRVMTLRLNALAAELIRAWMAPHDSLAAAVKSAATSADAAMGPKFMDSLGGLLADYLQRGIVRGSLPATS